ncbi:MAG: hypothetical protein MZV70_76365 [Desulfobacterales bacterium]|nr:hypothetical protein [Desulfobacterales bacterium]
MDDVSEVIHLNTADIGLPSVLIDMEEDTEFILGIEKYHGRLLILINPQKF